ncbi:MAG: Gfo/Idh/MocA family oxidoreductase [Balneola sp.]|nr:Gfo/Idh/MocA family oxidoreductase [Balneola sp.]MBO6651951.1 Gfo/Idh/MocA family oxidoreductase [Balneola sp.]MBO6711786.1 Gfo/Idh/MocA family oxidoreductase [Balneola sp.]MBO6799980.1 Gfo/Idh/MocA family oxidoreductase [Balneola sp.]MBO6871225.1 Gfo/Idh/MocA family oxidoreductase [Balneola sp.]
MSKIKFSVLGFGRIGQRHAKIIHEYEDSDLISVVDTDPSQLEATELLGLSPEKYISIEEFIANDKHKSEVVNIATPNGFHTDYAIKLLEAGYHVVIEKPMGLSLESCEKVLSTMIESGKQAFVVKQNRYSPPSLWLKEIVSENILGDILMVQTNCYWNRDQRYYSTSDWRGTRDLDGGALFTQFSHFIDLLYWVFGDIKNVKSVIKNFTHPNLENFDDSGIAQFEFVKGGLGILNYSTSCWDKNMESSITVVGTKGSLKVGGQYMNEIEYCHIKDYIMPELPETNPPNDYGPYKGSAANHHYVIENVVNALKGKKSATTNVFEGMKVVGFIEKIYRAGGFIK